MIEITHGRNNHLIDPHLEIWEWPIAAYLFLGGLVAGLMILNGVFRLNGKSDDVKASWISGPIWAPILLSLGMFFLWIDLSYKTHVYRFYMTFQLKSPMSWGAWILILVYPAQILGMALPGGLTRFGKPLQFLNPAWEFIKTTAQSIPQTVAWVNITMGIMLGIYTGVLLSVTAARPLWNTSLLPVLFVVSGLSTATAWNMLSRPSGWELKSLVKWDIGLLALELVILLLIVISLLTGTEAHQSAALLILGGPYTPVFWVFVIILGLAAPLWLEIRESMHLPGPVWIAPALVLLGGLVLRLVLVYAGQVSQIPDAEMMSGMGRH